MERQGQAAQAYVDLLFLRLVRWDKAIHNKGTAVINRGDLPPLACLELLSIAPLLTAELYRDLGVNAARYAGGLQPDPVRNPYTDQAIEGRYHAEVVALTAVEREACRPDAPPVELRRAE